MAKWWKEASAAQRRWIGTFSYEDMGAGKCQSQRRWRQRSTARVTAKIRPGLLRPNPRIFLFADTSGRKHCNPWISHPNENKKGHEFLSSRWWVAYNIFWHAPTFEEKKTSHFSIQIFKQCWSKKNRSELLFWMILNYFEVVFHHRSCHFAHSFPSAHSPFRTKVSLLPTFYFLFQLFLAPLPPLNHWFND